MKSMKKWMGIVAAGVMSMALGMTAIAAPSPSVNGIVQAITEATDADGNVITADLEELDETGNAAVEQLKDMTIVKELLGDEFVEGMEILDAQEVSVPEGTKFPATLTFRVVGVVPTTKIAVLHYDGTAWEKVSSKAGEGIVEATFDSLSPVAFVVDRNTMSSSTASTGSTTSPKTGESTAVMGFALVALLAAGGAWALSAKKRA